MSLSCFHIWSFKGEDLKHAASVKYEQHWKYTLALREKDKIFLCGHGWRLFWDLESFNKFTLKCQFVSLLFLEAFLSPFMRTMQLLKGFFPPAALLYLCCSIDQVLLQLLCCSHSFVLQFLIARAQSQLKDPVLMFSLNISIHSLHIKAGNEFYRFSEMVLGCRFAFFQETPLFDFHKRDRTGMLLLSCQSKQWLFSEAYLDTHRGHIHLPGKESVCYENKPKLGVCLFPLLLVCRTPWAFFWLHNTVFSCLFLRQRAEREPFSLCSLFRLISLCPVVSDFFLKYFSQKFSAFSGDCDNCGSLFLIYLFVSFHS